MKFIGELRAMKKEEALDYFIFERRQNAKLISELYEELAIATEEIEELKRLLG